MKKKYLPLFIKILPFFLLAIVSLIPVYFTWGKLAIGGDTILPFGPEGIKKFLWQWYGSENGQYFSQNLAPLYLIYLVLGYLSLSFTAISAVIFFSLNFISGLAIYKLCNLIYRPDNKLFLTFPVIFYVISPAVLKGWHYGFIYAFAPWFIYFITKIFVTRKLNLIDIVLANIVLFFASIDLPNPKYLFFLFIFAFVMLMLALVLKMINLRSILRNFWKISLFLLCSAYLLLPLVFFALNYSAEDYGVHIRQNYSDSGLFMDQDSTTSDRMIQLHQSTINIDAGERAIYNDSKVVVFAGSIFFLCILLNFLFKKDRERSKIELMFLALIALFLFFAIGPNPPLGFIYKGLVSNIGLLAFLRTTAGAVFFLSIFYSVLLFGFIENFKDRNKLAITVVLFLALLASSYPLIDGKFYKNLDIVGNPTVDKKSYGVNIPDEYFEIKEIVDKQKIDGKLLHLKNDLAYINTDWGYFGPSVYNFLFDYYNLGFNNVYSKSANHSAALTLDDKSLFVDKDKPLIDVGEVTIVAENKILSLKAAPLDNYLPHFWIPTKTHKVKFLMGDLLQDAPSKNIGEAVYLVSQNKLNGQTLDSLPEQTLSQPTIEYRKINPTKYRLIVHSAKSSFPVVFNEASNNGWKIYLENHRAEDSESLQKSLNAYTSFEYNENFQATKADLSKYIEQGLVSNLRNDADLDFVSKNIAGTIQNDNLPKGSFFETWFQKPILGESHLTVNGYANSWLIEPGAVCGSSTLCQKNPDGSFDFEFVVEFAPQRGFWFGLAVSVVTIILILSVVVFVRPKRRNTNA